MTKNFEMKTILLLLIVTLLYSCVGQKELQADLVDVKLVKIETVQRHPDVMKKLLTWKDINDVRYVTYAPLTNNYTIGSTMRVIIRR